MDARVAPSSGPALDSKGGVRVDRSSALIAILVIAAVLQVLAALVAIRLEPIGGMRRWWYVITAALVIQAGRRLYETVSQPHIGDALAALAISALLLTGVIGISVTFSRERRTRRSLSQEQGRDESYSHYADVAIVVLDEHARVRSMNPTACAITGCDERDALDKDWFDTFVPGPERAELRDRFMQLMTSPIEDDAYVQYDLIDTAGRAHSMSWHRRVLRDKDGRSVGTRSAGVDLTEQRRLERELLDNDVRNGSLLRLYALLGGANTYSAILAALLDELPKGLGYTGARLLVVDADQQRMSLVQTESTAEKTVHPAENDADLLGGESDGERLRALPIADDPFLKEILEATHIIMVDDARTDPRTDDGAVSAQDERTAVYVPLMLAGRKLGVLETGTFGDEGVRPPSRGQLDYLMALANHVAVAMDRVQSLRERSEAAAALKQAAEDAQAALDSIVQSLASTTVERDLYTAMHQEQVARLACAIAEEMGLSEETVEGIRIAGVLHDIGKIAVPNGILVKPGKLNEMEFGIVRTHSEVGERLLERVPFHTPVATIVRQHHERLDGSGYPDGLHADEILQESKILAVADVVEAMSSHRPYRAALGVDAAIEEITREAGKTFDAEVVAACVKVLSAQEFSFAGPPEQDEVPDEPWGLVH